MVPSKNPHTFHHQWQAGGGRGGVQPLPPQLPGQWRPGMPSHWTEQTSAVKWRSRVRRVLYLLQLIATAAYLQFRARRTIAVFDRSRSAAYLAYQILFFVTECVCVLPLFFQMLQVWNVIHRNCVDFKRIPLSLIKPHFKRAATHSNSFAPAVYPSVAVYIPCYNEEATLVRQTVEGAIKIDCPRELLSVYLCDDGQDPQKKQMMSELKLKHPNVFYVTRPEHKHAKAGNLNYALERSHSDLVITLDADFIPRPNIIQRLMPYFYVWNPTTSLYEFNETLAVVQTPQHFRNLSPYDSDPLDQRSLLFFDVVQHGKDWFNAATMVGTNNLISRAALEEAEFYPYYSITEDSAMTLKFHSLGYRTYYVNESLATGLATTSLRSNLRQRARWMKGDWQILFSKNGPLAVRGLTFMQRLMYFNMGLGRLMSFVFTFYDVASIVLLLGGIAPLDVQYPIVFIMYLAAFLVGSIMAHISLTAGGRGLNKSSAGNSVFESIFRYTTMKGLFVYLFKGQNLVFKVTDKSTAASKAQKTEVSDEIDSSSGSKEQDDSCGSGVSYSSCSGDQVKEISDSSSDLRVDINSESSHRKTDLNSTEGQARGTAGCFGDKKVKNRQERQWRRKELLQNLRRVWFNILTAVVLIFSMIWGIVRPPIVDTTVDGNSTAVQNGDFFPMAMAIGFTAASVLPHLVAIFLCFGEYVSEWMLADVVHGRCDQFAVQTTSGKLFVPWSYINLVTIARMVLVFGSITFVLVYTILNSDPVEIGLP